MDALQDVFVQVLRRGALWDAQSPSSMLYRMATNVCLNHLRTVQRRPEDSEEEILLALATVECPEDQSMARAMLERIFGREPASTRTIAVLHWVDQMTLAEVAEEVGLSVSGVRKRLRMLRARIPGGNLNEE